MRPTVILLSFNSEDTLGATLARARQVSDEIFVVDSFSKDSTVALAESFGAKVVEHAFENYGAQRNWGIDNLPITGKWQLHLDADEVMDDELIAAILALPDQTLPDPALPDRARPGQPQHAGYFVPRYVRFLGRVLRHGGMSPTWHLRLFRTGVGRCEDRKYDQHFLLAGPQATGNETTGQLPGVMIDDIAMNLSEWTARHNRWADGEVAEMSAALLGEAEAGRLVADPKGNPAQRKRAMRQKYNNLPLFVRPFVLFGYRFFFRLGFLDGTEGFIFWVLQTFWFRFLIDAKIWEKRNIH